ncbi:hypothetical protein LAZ67_X000981 [Cordylochernes scorpioides]|uniref:Uncharacterized protein n=1 Tax=Cordylochernes scorpioides TaxID=51811 RepID=A0ABY6LUN2_9ARAC|nr:hypothetical protein LAZ67_X000981 [Cordylochernes scorpioides]
MLLHWTKNYFGKAFNFPVNLEIFFIQNDNDVERALKFQRDLKFCMSGYRELYKELVKPSQRLITDYLVKEKKSLKFLKKHYHVDLMTYNYDREKYSSRKYLQAGSSTKGSNWEKWPSTSISNQAALSPAYSPPSSPNVVAPADYGNNTYERDSMRHY